MTISMLVILRIAHVIAGAFWLGAVLFVAGFLLPAARTAGPAGGQVMNQIVQVRRLPLYMHIAVITCLVSGGVLLWWASGGFNVGWLSSRTGIVWSIGGLLAVAVALLGEFVNAPTARRFAELAAGVQAQSGPPSDTVLAEMKRLQTRLLHATQLAAVLLLLSAAAMAAARYLA